MRVFFLINVFIFYLFSAPDLKSAQLNNFDEGVKLYNMKNFLLTLIFYEKT